MVSVKQSYGRIRYMPKMLVFLVYMSLISRVPYMNTYSSYRAV
jgi:hypothetical protein